MQSALRWLLWGPAAAIILSAVAVTGGVALFLAPPAGVLYGAFCLVAWLGPNPQEVKTK